ncbi:protein max-like isoform X2 [Linepithema humile]|uniref:protein max-like isoform X2 n=1 Tax=Linepithema humile TaxID=83485 RepID=UPI00351E9B15
MSDDDRDIDIESDAEKRAHHNALERKRRDHIKDKFIKLRDTIPKLAAEKVASRAHILRESIKFIRKLRQSNLTRRQYNEDLKRQNIFLENQVYVLEKLISDHYAKLKREGKPIPALNDYDDDSEFSDSEVECYNLSYN